LAKAKLAFFISMAKSSEKFLTKFQTDKPMAPFLCSELEKLIKSCTKRFIKTGVQKEFENRSIDIDVKDLGNYKSYKEIDPGFVASDVLQQSKVSRENKNGPFDHVPICSHLLCI
jgi:hypothetical protein